ncbi:MAG: GAF domain-containing sensor histidine kinase [Acidimicrobiia bacterium]
MTATLPRPHIEADEAPDAPHWAVIARWHELRRVAGLIALVLAVVSGIFLSWPAMVLVAIVGAASAVDATLALRSHRTRVTPTLVADITFTGIALVVVAVPAAAIGMVVAYYVLLLAVLTSLERAWPIGLYVVVVGVAATVLPSVLNIAYSTERSLIAGVLVVAVFGLSIITISSEILRVRKQGSEITGRRIGAADAVADASMALVSLDESVALEAALEEVRAAIDVSVVFVERNIEDPTLGLCAAVVDRASDHSSIHPTLDRRAKVPWSAMPGARAHLQGGAPFFYRVEESRGTAADRAGGQGLRVEVNVPIIADGVWLGVVGAADVDADRLWRIDDLLLLRTMADLTAAFWQRARSAQVRDSLIGSLDGRLRFEEAIARASRALLGEQTGGVEPALQVAGLAVGVDEVMVTETIPGDEGEPAAHVLSCWATPGFSPTAGPGDSWSYSEHDTIRDDIQRGEVAHDVGSGVSRVVAGIEVDGAWFGSVWFTSTDTDRQWIDGDWAFVRTIADMLGAYYGRARDRARLQDSLRSKDQLIATVSHELRTPLTAVGGLADELRSAGDEFGVEDRDQLLEVISLESIEMADLIEDLLVAARSEDGNLPVFPEEVDLCDLAKATVRNLMVPPGKTVDVVEGETLAFADAVRVRQITRNLLTNAFRYGGDTVVVTFGSDDGHSWVDVTDDGEGIPPEDRAAIFQPYMRSGSSSTVKTSVGLGLTLSRRLAELMGGMLNYVDPADQGSTFRLAVPRRSGVEVGDVAAEPDSAPIPARGPDEFAGA